MKLPEGRKERIQTIVLVAIGATAVVYAVIQLGIVPLFESRRRTAEQLQQLVEKLNKAGVELKYAPSTRRDFERVVSDVGMITSNHVVHPVLGSYLLAVRETLDTAARRAEFRVGSVRDLGIREFPGKNRDGSEHTFKAYSVEMSGLGGYHQLLNLIRILEEQNPYLSVTEINVAGRLEDPEQHRMSVRIEWPTKAETPEQSASSASGSGAQTPGEPP
jgi:hypothetical protein